MPKERPKRFSERLEIRRPPDGLIYEDAPQPVRHAFLNMLQEMEPVLPTWGGLYRKFESALDKWSAKSGYVIVGLNNIGHLVESCDWHEFYDLVETAVGVLGESAGVRDSLPRLLGRVAEWQTRWLQVPVSFGTWGFKSPFAHHERFYQPQAQRSRTRNGS